MFSQSQINKGLGKIGKLKSKLQMALTGVEQIGVGKAKAIATSAAGNPTMAGLPRELSDAGAVVELGAMDKLQKFYEKHPKGMTAGATAIGAGLSGATYYGAYRLLKKKKPEQQMSAREQLDTITLSSSPAGDDYDPTRFFPSYPNKKVSYAKGTEPADVWNRIKERNPETYEMLRAYSKSEHEKYQNSLSAREELDVIRFGPAGLFGRKAFKEAKRVSANSADSRVTAEKWRNKSEGVFDWVKERRPDMKSGDDALKWAIGRSGIHDHFAAKATREAAEAAALRNLGKRALIKHSAITTAGLGALGATGAGIAYANRKKELSAREQLDTILFGLKDKLRRIPKLAIAAGSGGAGIIGGVMIADRTHSKSPTIGRVISRPDDLPEGIVEVIPISRKKLNQLSARDQLDTILFARGDFLLKRMAQSGGKAMFPMAESKALIGAARGNVEQTAAGLADLGGATRGGMGNIRNYMASQVKSARAGGLLKAPSPSAPSSLPALTRPARPMVDTAATGRRAVVGAMQNKYNSDAYSANPLATAMEKIKRRTTAAAGDFTGGVRNAVQGFRNWNNAPSQGYAFSAREELNTILFANDPRPRDQQGQFTDANGNMIDPNSIHAAYKQQMQQGQPQQQEKPEEEQDKPEEEESKVKKLISKLKKKESNKKESDMKQNNMSAREELNTIMFMRGDRALGAAMGAIGEEFPRYGAHSQGLALRLRKLRSQGVKVPALTKGYIQSVKDVASGAKPRPQSHVAAAKEWLGERGFSARDQLDTIMLESDKKKQFVESPGAIAAASGTLAGVGGFIKSGIEKPANFKNPRYMAASLTGGALAGLGGYGIAKALRRDPNERAQMVKRIGEGHQNSLSAREELDMIRFGIKPFFKAKYPGGPMKKYIGEEAEFMARMQKKDMFPEMLRENAMKRKMAGDDFDARMQILKDKRSMK